ncbi:MAG: NUDIX hydrolase [Mycobacteriales bacterium]
MSHVYDVLSSEVVYSGGVMSLRRDDVAMPGDTHSVRDVVVHPGAVAVVALDEDNQMVLVRQYRHPVGRQLDELPAGLLDKAGEPAHETAARELAEEAGLAAAEWHVLVDVLTTPGMSDEAIRIYLARDLREVERDVQQHEEAEMTSFRRPLELVVAAVMTGEYENGLLVAGALAADRAVRTGLAGLRSVDAPWPARAP